jgi:predicted enzyme related to lactoylglutathione lyase
MSGRVVHFEIPFDDGARARSFYADAFGWQATELPGMGYTLLTTGPSSETEGPTEKGFINGGMFGREGWPAVPAPVITIDVEDVEAALEKVEQLGGKTVLGKQAVGDMGWSAYFTDTEGNTIGLWQSALS